MMVNYKVKNYTAHISNPTALHADVIEVTTGHTIKSNLEIGRAHV